MIRVDESLAGSLAERSHGRVIAIDAYRRWSCGVWIGDLIASWVDEPPGAGYVSGDPVEGVPVVVRSSLARLLDEAGPSLTRGGPLHRDGLRIALARPELWLDWLAFPQR